MLRRFALRCSDFEFQCFKFDLGARSIVPLCTYRYHNDHKFKSFGMTSFGIPLLTYFTKMLYFKITILHGLMRLYFAVSLFACCAKTLKYSCYSKSSLFDFCNIRPFGWLEWMLFSWEGRSHLLFSISTAPVGKVLLIEMFRNTLNFFSGILTRVTHTRVEWGHSRDST